MWDLRFSQLCYLSFKSSGMCRWMGSSWSVEGSTSYYYTYVTPHISPNLAILGLLDPKGKSTTILQNTGNHLPNDLIMFQKTWIYVSLRYFNYVHNMTICYDRVLMRNRHEILSKLHSSVSKNQQDAYWQGITNRIQIKAICPQQSTKQRPKSQTFHDRGIPSQWASLQPSIYKHTISDGCLFEGCVPRFLLGNVCDIREHCTRDWWTWSFNWTHHRPHAVSATKTHCSSMGTYFLSEKSTVKMMYSHTKSSLVIRSKHKFLPYNIKGRVSPFIWWLTNWHQFCRKHSMSYRESKLKMYRKKLQQKSFIFPIQDTRNPAQRKYTMKKELLFEGCDW